MADNPDEELIENPTNNQSENLPDQIISTNDTDTNNPNQETNNMEVHHHSHYEGKNNWKSHVWEFLMLFLAVFCGFFAEYQLEHKIERDREKEYILSMIEDAKTDTANIHAAIALNTRRVYNLDSLSNKCFYYIQSGNDDPAIYKLFQSCLRHPDFVTPTERTMTQLKYSGGMRLLRNKIAADSILQYDGFAKKLTNQQEWYEYMLRELIESGVKIFNFKYNAAYDLVELKRPVILTNDSAKLHITDKSVLIEFGNKANLYRNVVIFYILLLHEGEKHATNLIQTLQIKYRIENERR